MVRCEIYREMFLPVFHSRKREVISEILLPGMRKLELHAFISTTTITTASLKFGQFDHLSTSLSLASFVTFQI